MQPTGTDAAWQAQFDRPDRALLDPAFAAALRDAGAKADEIDVRWRDLTNSRVDDALTPIEGQVRSFTQYRGAGYRRKAALCRRAADGLAGEVIETRERVNWEWTATADELPAAGSARTRAWWGARFGAPSPVVEPVPDAALVAKSEREHKLRGSARWYEQRATGQAQRFGNIRGCGKTLLKVSCLLTGTEQFVMPSRCGVVRLCEACAKLKALERRNRIADRRFWALQDAARDGLLISNRAGGAFTEKMLTLTVPHFDRAAVEPFSKLDEDCRDIGLDTTTNARVRALYLAWPRFYGRVRRWMRGEMKKHPRKFADPRDADRTIFYRLTEWTRGTDGNGHPHFHVYLFSPFLPQDLLASWWAESLRKIGAPVARDAFDRDVIVADIRHLRGFNVHALAELVKSGRRRALETVRAKLGELDALPSYAPRRTQAAREGGAGVVLRYADATMARTFAELRESQDARAAGELFCALEGRRLAQGSRGFAEPAPPATCRCCRVAVDGADRSVLVVSVVDPLASRRYEPTGPPPTS